MSIRFFMFLKNYPFSKSTTLTAVFMILSASFTRQLMEFSELCIGKQGFKMLIIVFLILSAAVFLITESKRLCRFSMNFSQGKSARPNFLWIRHQGKSGAGNFLRIFAMAALLALTFLLLQKIELPQVRMHILMYAVVGWLASRDATKYGLTFRAAFIAWFFASLAGALEEAFQKLLPYRVFDIQDIIFNIAGASLGVLLFLIRSAWLGEQEIR